MNTTNPHQPYSRTAPSGVFTRRRAAFRAVTVISGLSVAAITAVPGAVPAGAAVAGGGTPRAGAGPDMEFVHARPPGLLRPGEKVTLTAFAEIDRSETVLAGAAYVRRGTHGRFTRLRMRFSADVDELSVKVPGRFLRGSTFQDYVVVRDPHSGQVVTLPAGGAAAPYRSWIVNHPVAIKLGTHRFGHFAKPQAIVARAPVGSGPGQVGILLPGPQTALGYGPESFDIAQDGTVWVADTVNGRLLAYAPGKPGFPQRTVTTLPLPVELTIAPNGRIYVMTGSPFSPDNPRKVTAFSPKGKRLWAEPVYDFNFNNVMRADHDGVVWIDDGILGWVPVTTRAGRPLSIAQQIRRVRPYQPLGGGLQLPATAMGDHEDRIGLATTTGTLRRSWRLTSPTPSDPEWPQARVGGSIVEFALVAQPSTHRTEHLVVRFSPAGHITNKISLDFRLEFGYAFGPFSAVRIGPDGMLYYLQTSDKWGMRVARYRWH